MTDPIRFAGYASLFDIPDAAHDTVRRGAFLQTIADHERPIPLLWQHQPTQKIGEIEHISEDEKGLRVIAKVDAAGSRAAKALRSRAVNGLSFGYRARDYRKSSKGRELLGVDLFEVSLVTHPLQHAARVHFVA